MPLWFIFVVRIALIAPGFSRDGDDWAIPALQSLAVRLAQQHDVHVFSLRYPPAGITRFAGLTHHAIGGGEQTGMASLNVWRRALQAVLAAHRRTPFHLFHAFWADEPALVATLAGRMLRRPALASVGGGELVYFPDIDYGTGGSAARRLLIRLALWGATAVTAGSNYQRQLCLNQGLPPEKVKVAPLGVDVNRFRARAGPSPAEDSFIVQTASLTPVKQQSLLLEIMAQVRETSPAARLLLAGDGPLRRTLENQAEALGLENAICWRGHVPHPEMTAVYQQGRLYLQTSRHESQGMAVLEAMACGLPALGTPVGILPQVAAAPPGWEAERLAAQVVALLTDRALYRQQRARARRLVETCFSLKGAVGGFLELYETLLRNGN